MVTPLPHLLILSMDSTPHRAPHLAMLAHTHKRQTDTDRQTHIQLTRYAIRIDIRVQNIGSSLIFTLSASMTRFTRRSMNLHPGHITSASTIII